MGSLTVTAESDDESNVKIGQRSPKLRARIECPVLMTRGVEA